MNIEFSFIVIDDSELDRFVTQKFLERSTKSLVIKTFQNAQHALEVISETIIEDTSIPIIILLDLQMPVMNGLNFVKNLKNSPLRLKKIIGLLC